MVAGTSLFSSLLARLMVRHRVGVTVTQTLSLTRVESDYFDLGTEA
jgi:restriction endonuclease Mrr